MRPLPLPPKGPATKQCAAHLPEAAVLACMLGQPIGIGHELVGVGWTRRTVRGRLTRMLERGLIEPTPGASSLSPRLTRLGVLAALTAARGSLEM